jgi:hypothetical protein
VKHRVNSFLELDSIGFIDIVGAYPKVFQVVTLSLFTVELYLAVASLALAFTV